MQRRVEVDLRGRWFRVYWAVLVLGACLVAFTGGMPQAAQTAVPPTEPAVEEVDLEVIELRAQLEQMRRTDDQLLETIYWSLGGLVTVSVILVGYSWFSSTRTHERDREALKQELRSLVREDISVAERKLREQAEQVLEQVREDAHREITQGLDVTRRTLSGTTDRLQHNVNRLRFDLLSSEAKQYEHRGVHSVALSRYMMIIELGQEMKWEWIVGKGLDGIKGVLRKGHVPDADDVRKLTVLLDKMPTDYAIEIESTKRLLAEARSK